MNEFDRPKRKRFNVTGPCNEKDHYMLPPLARLPEVVDLICDQQYFLLHAARQSGKTTALLALANRINQSETQRALYCSLEAVQQIEDHDKAIGSIAILVLRAGATAGIISLDDAQIRQFTESCGVSYTLNQALKRLSKSCEKQLVVLFDEVDCLPEMVLISFLRQLRDGYVSRSAAPFPSSIALVGMRRIQDYKALIRNESQTLDSASPFNITRESLTLRNFTLEEVRTLYLQHTMATGQVFEDAVFPLVMEYTGGQPWLVNAIAAECVEKIHGNRVTERITADDVRTAKENIIRRRDTHMLSLLKRLDEERVLRVVEAVVSGSDFQFELDDPALEYVLDLGILKREEGALVPANRMYAEMIARYLSWMMQDKFQRNIREPPWVQEDGLDMNWLVKDFQTFWRKDASSWKEMGHFREAAPHVLFMAFLQRVVNGGGHITREMALGSYRLDIGLDFRGKTYAIEIKMKDHYEETKAVAQLGRYLEKLNVMEGWLLVFDPKPIPKRGGARRFTWKDVSHDGHTIHIVGL